MKSLKRINTVLFDFDGTLVNSNELIADSWRYTVMAMTGRGITDDEIRSTLGELLIDSLRRMMPGADAEQAMDIYRSYQHDRYLDGIALYDGAGEVLQKLKKAGYKTGLVTSRLKSSTERGLAHFGLDGLFDAVLTASDTDKFKPDPEPLYIILDRLGSKAEESIFVGDTVHDIEAGLSAGVVTALVDYSFALPPKKRKDAPEPDIVIKDLMELLSLLGTTGQELPDLNEGEKKMQFIKEQNRIYSNSETGEIIAEVTFPAQKPGVVNIDHTFVDDSLRGQGIAGKLMEECYSMLKGDGRKAVLTCPYAVKWYREHPEKNDIVEKLP